MKVNMSTPAVLGTIDRLALIAQAIVKGKPMLNEPEFEVTGLLQSVQAENCPSIDSIAAYAWELFDSQKASTLSATDFRFSEIAEGVRRHFPELTIKEREKLKTTECFYCRLLLCWFMAINEKGTKSEGQSYKLVFARKVQELAEALSSSEKF
jgi:hypothetical protein